MSPISIFTTFSSLHRANQEIYLLPTHTVSRSIPRCPLNMDTCAAKGAADPFREAYNAVRGLGLTLGGFMEGCLKSRDDRIRQATANWAKYSPERSYGPTRLAEAVMDNVRESADGAGVDALSINLLRLAVPAINAELKLANRVPALKSAGMIETMCQGGTNELVMLSDTFERHLPILFGLLEFLMPDTEQESGSDTEDEEESADGSDDEATELHEAAQLPENATNGSARALTKVQCAKVVVMSVMLAQRNKRMNALQAMLGAMLVFSYAPKSIHTLLNRLSLSTSRSTSYRHLGQACQHSQTAITSTMADTERVKVLLFDNIDIYLRVGDRITASNRLVNLTSRTLLRLPSAFKASNISADKLQPFMSARSLGMKDIEGDPHFLQRAVMLQVAKELRQLLKEQADQSGQSQPSQSSQPGDGGVPSRSPQRRPRYNWRPAQALRLLDQVISSLFKAHTIDAVKPDKWDAKPLPLLEENEGSMRGTLAVLAESARGLGIVEATPGSQSSSSTLSLPPRRRFDVLPAGGTLLVAGDLKTHRNVAAAMETRREYADEAERLSWHHPVWAIFKMHFSPDKVGYEVSLERVRDGLCGGKAALRAEEPSYNEAWQLIRQTFAGRIRQLAQTKLPRHRRLESWLPQSTEEVMELLKDVEQSIDGRSVAAAIRENNTLGAHARLFFRDAVLGLELDDACRHGDVGRILETTKFLALGFAGAGKHIYAEACLDDIWASRVLETNTWRTLSAARLINRSRESASFYGVDLYQEHINRELQRVDLTHGVDTAVHRLRTVYSTAAEVSRATRERHSTLLTSNSRLTRKKQAVKDVERVRAFAELDKLFSARQEQRLPSEDTTVTVDADTIPLRAVDLLAGRLQKRPISDMLTLGYSALAKSGLRRWQGKTSDEERHDALLAEEVARDEEQENNDTLPTGDMADDVDREAVLRHRAWSRRTERLLCDDDHDHALPVATSMPGYATLMPHLATSLLEDATTMPGPVAYNPRICRQSKSRSPRFCRSALVCTDGGGACRWIDVAALGSGKRCIGCGWNGAPQGAQHACAFVSPPSLTYAEGRRRMKISGRFWHSFARAGRERIEVERKEIVHPIAPASWRSKARLVTLALPIRRKRILEVAREAPLNNEIDARKIDSHAQCLSAYNDTHCTLPHFLEHFLTSSSAVVPRDALDRRVKAPREQSPLSVFRAKGGTVILAGLDAPVVHDMCLVEDDARNALGEAAFAHCVTDGTVEQQHFGRNEDESHSACFDSGKSVGVKLLRAAAVSDGVRIDRYRTDPCGLEFRGLEKREGKRMPPPIATAWAPGQDGPGPRAKRQQRSFEIEEHCRSYGRAWLAECRVQLLIRSVVALAKRSEVLPLLVLGAGRAAEGAQGQWHRAGRTRIDVRPLIVLEL
ncbi:hypothetical protein V8E36_009595 [Tilletia maclaganii]